jgi:magnesium chelatase subunit I
MEKMMQEDRFYKNQEAAESTEIPVQNGGTSVRSLQELIDLVSGRKIIHDTLQEETGLAEHLPFPFLGLVGQYEMKLALLLTLINPKIGGVLLIGPRGTGKTTAVRGLIDLLPDIKVSKCVYGCLEEDIETGGMDAVCPECAKKFAEGIPLSKTEKSKLVELPLNAQLSDVIGSLDERATLHDRFRIKRGILSRADKNLLYVDEVNLLSNEIIDAILDASAQGHYTVRRGPISATYNARFALIGSMNPEEGKLRPQIMDRFGLRVIVHGLQDADERLEAYQRTLLHREKPRLLINQFLKETQAARKDVQAARDLLPDVKLSKESTRLGIHLIQTLKLNSLRAEITLFEAARAYAAADGRKIVESDDLKPILPLSLRLRESDFIQSYFAQREDEDKKLNEIYEKVSNDFK